jgi:transcriptional regulator GlxA family with amidase domain
MEDEQMEMKARILEAMEYMRQHYREDLTTQSVAEKCGYTREYFCRLFKRYANQTFKHYLTSLRLAATVEAMRESDQSARQLAICNGFPDEKSFFLAFRQEYGTTPARWREENQSNDTSQNGTGHKMEEKRQK